MRHAQTDNRNSGSGRDDTSQWSYDGRAVSHHKSPWVLCQDVKTPVARVAIEHSERQGFVRRRNSGPPDFHAFQDEGIGSFDESRLLLLKLND